MIKALIRGRIAAAEKAFGENLDHLRYILAISLGAFRRYSKIFPLSSYRNALPADAFHVARLVSVRAQDCGTCVQTVVNQAKADGVPVDVLKAVVASTPDALPPDLADVYRFATAVTAATYDEDPLRDKLRERYGPNGLVELAIAIAAVPFYPLSKRALGYAKSCSKVVVDV